MASTDQSAHAVTTSPQNVPRPAQPQSDLPTSSTPLEMSSLPSNNNLQDLQLPTGGQIAEPMEAGSAQLNAAEPSRTEQSTQTPNALPPSPPAILSRNQSTQIGPSLDEPIPVLKDAEETGRTLMITLLLINGGRHPFKLDAKYLSKRNVEVQANDPFNLSVYKLKELILREWREGRSTFIEQLCCSQD